MLADPLRVVPDLPDGWLPEPALILAFAKTPDEHDASWEVLLPEYTVVGRGATFHDAMSEAAELLEDYLRMCASEGTSFEDARRPIKRTWFANLFARAAAGAVASRLKDHAQRRTRVLRFPVDGGSAHAMSPHSPPGEFLRIAPDHPVFRIDSQRP